MPKQNTDVRRMLAQELTAVFSKITGHPPEIFGVRFFEYEPGQAASGGKLCDDLDAEPYLHALLYCPRLKRGTKASVVASLTETFTKAVNRPNWMPTIHICEHPYDNIAVGGKLLSELYEECARKKFYYDLPSDE